MAVSPQKCGCCWRKQVATYKTMVAGQSLIDFHLLHRSVCISPPLLETLLLLLEGSFSPCNVALGKGQLWMRSYISSAFKLVFFSLLQCAGISPKAGWTSPDSLLLIGMCSGQHSSVSLLSFLPTMVKWMWGSFSNPLQVLALNKVLFDHFQMYSWVRVLPGHCHRMLRLFYSYMYVQIVILKRREKNKQLMPPWYTSWPF